jgi:hypothetical protein
MTELSGALIAYDWPLTLTEAELAAVSTDMHVGTRKHDPGECRECMEVYRTARRMIAAATAHIAAEERERLAAAGQLLPEGSKHSVTFRIRWIWSDGYFDDWEFDDSESDSIEHVRDQLAGRWPVRKSDDTEPEHYELTWQQTWTSPRAPVPVEVLAG